MRAVGTVLLALAALLLAGCQSFRPADIYPHMPPNSSFERKITTVWGQTEVVYKTGNFDPKAEQPVNP